MKFELGAARGTGSSHIYKKTCRSSARCPGGSMCSTCSVLLAAVHGAFTDLGSGSTRCSVKQALRWSGPEQEVELFLSVRPSVRKQLVDFNISVHDSRHVARQQSVSRAARPWSRCCQSENLQEQLQMMRTFSKSSHCTGPNPARTVSQEARGLYQNDAAVNICIQLFRT